MSVATLKHAEPVTLDRDQLEVLYRQLGPVGADKVVNHALEELAALLAGVAVDYRAGRMAELAANGRALAAVAQQVGMTKLARVARDVADVATGHDAAALCAVTARLERIGDRSLVAVWDMADGIG
ncbi:hypothetical protein [Maritimibacter sp. UBA3975]|uniref:hypothetical protein n=1 Tax=Maritimibacter sp. UBA3975 TaxID=1946833 RepID=UPI000C0B04AC|nr:hypothetical protein [Maritimibacter sp. UBA3975]MAM61979.1 hypothetical protein [Maritimibacter sp.]|tara:strand:- start:766 stop:1143 length:378 start_codon:yes stop_codon:yes gene_type:complete